MFRTAPNKERDVIEFEYKDFMAQRRVDYSKLRKDLILAQVGYAPGIGAATVANNNTNNNTDNGGNDEDDDFDGCDECEYSPDDGMCIRCERLDVILTPPVPKTEFKSTSAFNQTFAMLSVPISAPAPIPNHVPAPTPSPNPTYELPTKSAPTLQDIFEVLKPLRWRDKDDSVATLQHVRVVPTHTWCRILMDMGMHSHYLIDTIRRTLPGVINALSEEEQRNLGFHIIARGAELYHAIMADPTLCMYMLDNDCVQPLYTFVKQITTPSR